MLPFWSQALSLAILFLNITRIVASAESDLKKGFRVFEGVVEDALSALLDNSDGIIAQFSMSRQSTPPISPRLINSGIESNIQVGLYCESCNNVQPPAFNFTESSYTLYDKSWLGFALESFDAAVEVEIELTAVENGEIALTLLKIPAPVGEDGVIVEVEFQLVVEATASETMSFTTGLNLTLQDPAAIMMPALDSLVNFTQSQVIGFNSDSFSLSHSFNSSIPQLDFSVQLSLRTVFSVSLAEIDIGSLFLDLPAFNISASTLTNALSNCQTAPTGTASDQVYSELIHMTGDLNAVLSYELLGGDKSGTIDTWKIYEPLDECYAFYPGVGSLGAVPASSKAAVLTATPVTTCTTAGTNGTNNTTTGTAAVSATVKSLSGGAKAGAVIGTLIGVVLISSLAFYLGRASAQRGPSDSGTISGPSSAPAWAAIPFSRSKKFFSRSDRKPTEFSPMTPSTSSWQNPAYDPAVVQSSDMGWQRPKEPFLSVNEAVSPSTSYVSSIGDDYNMPSPASGIGSPPAMYEAVRTPEQAEGLGLLQTRRISRKSVGGAGYISRSGSV